MSSTRGSRGRLTVAAFAAAGFAIALVALVSSQLALMSILDSGRAERAAEQIATSRFAADIIEQTVTRAIAPVAGADIARVAATAASTDPSVTRVVETSLVNAHRQIVDPDAPAEVIDGNLAVGTAIVNSILDTAAANGVDPAALGFDFSADDVASLDPGRIASDAGLPSVVPDDLPRLGLLPIAETTRVIALIALVLFAFIAITVHPRPGRSLRSLGTAIAVITGAWLVAMLLAGWVIGLIANTLFGELIDAVWSDAVPEMLLLVGAGVVIGVALVLAGVALDGYLRERRRRDDQRRLEYERYVNGYH